MKTLLLILLLSSASWAGQKSQFLENPKLNTEFEQNYFEHRFGNFVSLTASTATITQLNVSTVTLNGQTLTNFQFQAATMTFVTANTTTTSSTYQSTALSATITPSSASRRIKITVSGTGASNSISTVCRVTIFRGVTNLGAATGFANVFADSSTNIGSVGISYIDSPATTSATTYIVKIASSNNVNIVEWNPGASTSVIVLEEVL